MVWQVGWGGCSGLASGWHGECQRECRGVPAGWAGGVDGRRGTGGGFVYENRMGWDDAPLLGNRVIKS